MVVIAVNENSQHICIRNCVGEKLGSFWHSLSAERHYLYKMLACIMLGQHFPYIVSCDLSCHSSQLNGDIYQHSVIEIAYYWAENRGIGKTRNRHHFLDVLVGLAKGICSCAGKLEVSVLVLVSCDKLLAAAAVA